MAKRKPKEDKHSIMDVMEGYCRHGDLSISNKSNKQVIEALRADPKVVCEPGVVTITLKKLPVGLNVRDHTHWYLKYQSQAVWDAIGVQIRFGIPQETLKYPLLIDYTSFRVTLLDCDNHAASLKQFLDGLVHAGVLPDDGQAYVKEYFSHQEKVAHRVEQRAVVKLISLPKGAKVFYVIR